MSGLISFTGMSSDQDFNTIIQALVEARRTARVAPLESWQSEWEAKIESIGTVDSALSAFYNTVRGMDRPGEFLIRTATSSNTGVVSATASSTAAEGNHSLVVGQLAQAETEAHCGIQNGILMHVGVADRTDPVNWSGSDRTFSYAYGGTTRIITVADSASLEDLQAAINGDAANPGVTAKITSVGGLDRLVLTETTPDGTKTILVDPDGDMTLDGSGDTVQFGASGFGQTVNASGTDQVFQIQYGTDDPVDIIVPTGTTLMGLRDLINASGAGINAYILDDGGTGSAASHLILTGRETGDGHTIVLSPSGGTTLDGSSDTEDFSATAGVFTETTAACNAQLRVDGYPFGAWIERSTNLITDILDGLTVTLKDVGTVTLTVGTDKEAMISKIEAFREAFNSVRMEVKDATAYNPETGEAGTLLGNYALQIIKSRLDSLISGTAPGFRDGLDSYCNLLQLGFYTDAVEGSDTQGLLLLDQDILSNALDDDSDAVAAVFSAYFGGMTDSSEIRFSSTLPTATPGLYEVEVDTDNERAHFKLENGDWGDWVNLSGGSGAYTLTGVSGPERGIAMSAFLPAGSGIHTTQLRLQNGVITELGHELENLLSSSGPLSNLENHYEDIIENVESRISQEERRLLLYEERLKQQYARLDSYINRMSGIINSLISFMDNNAKSSN
ncbi:hypothetical protein TRIP_B200586 [uncultured Desulfatiglans sp.]|uniref:Flagellar hook-associated protein 2 n=1 Tax=Uncultured Desulfatiglans sp. TaxID=1748965 RepID=A0A653A333_UNCDX|nr:hypothetical protein TRIP_B200586 [uncultured Desulfatiglans sp.]